MQPPGERRGPSNHMGGGSSDMRRRMGGDSRNPRSREDRKQNKPWKHHTKIPIDDSKFPAHVRPAAVIIGAKGMNHARMQDESGCCVQLRGKGISSQGTPGADEPIHLWIKYDDEVQLKKVEEVLQDIIRSCENGPPPEARRDNRGGEGGRRGRTGGLSLEPRNLTEFLWRLHKLLIASEEELPLDTLPHAYRSFHGTRMRSDWFLGQRVSNDRWDTKCAAAELQRLGRHVVRVIHRGDTTTGEQILLAKAILPPNMTFAEFDRLDREHRPDDQHSCESDHRASSQAHVADVPSRHGSSSSYFTQPPPPPTTPPVFGRKDLPLTPLCLVLQAIHRTVAVSERPLPCNKLEEEYKAHWELPLDLAAAGFPNKSVIEFLHLIPDIVTITADSCGAVLVPQKMPDFKVVVDRLQSALEYKVMFSSSTSTPQTYPPSVKTSREGVPASTAAQSSTSSRAETSSSATLQHDVVVSSLVNLANCQESEELVKLLKTDNVALKAMMDFIQQQQSLEKR